MGVRDVIRNAIIQSLGGYTMEEVKQLCIRANNMGRLAKLGKYPDPKIAIMVIGHDRIIDRITTFLGFPRRKSGLQAVEVFRGRGAREVPVAPSEVVNEARPECLLAEIAGPSIRAQLDIQRECLPCSSSGEELQREEQVLDLVSPNSTERVQPSPSIQAS